MRVFAIGDPHLSLFQQKPMDIFGPDWAAHDERLAAAWRDSVAENDVVIVAGDISWALKTADALMDLAWIEALPGRKILVRGNHDLWWQGVTRLNALYEDMFFLQNNHLMIDPQKKLAVCGSRGWALPGLDDYTAADGKILARELIRLKFSLDSAMAAGAEEILCAMHFPPAACPQNKSVFTDLLGQYPVKQAVYGHLHGAAAFRKGISGEHDGILYRLVSFDFVDGKPQLIYNGEKG
ncbi:MAG: metallophosphoesterase [Clostridiales Family XIII bacterium]|jgi:predicted phosphohydrolase|nr:metallophosphoesterase [Clostridiales Family XIII bacterium]